jgi:dipeptidyl aminopeptidase/acylaminoacyl peptidase
MKKIASLLLLVCLTGAGWAQGTLQDYKNLYDLRTRTANKVFYSDVRPTWINASTFWYERTTPQGKEYIKVESARKKKSPLFDAKAVAGALAQQTTKKVDAARLNLENLRVSSNGDTLQFAFDSARWSFSLKDKKLVKREASERRDRGNRRNGGGYWGSWDFQRGSRNIPSPDGKMEAFLKDNNLYIRIRESKQEIALTHDGKPANYYSAYVQWSPDSRYLATMQIVPPKMRTLTLIESSPKDQLQPKIQTRDYLKPGDTLAINVPCIFNVETKKVMKADHALIPNAYSTEDIRWNEDSKAITFEYNQRGHQLYQVLEMEAASGAIRTLVNESSKTFVNYNRHFRLDLKGGKEMIWMSERDNWNHLYLYDRTSAKVKNQITKGEWYVREIIRVDEKKRQIIFSANGMEKEEDPYFIHYYRINMDGTGLVKLTEGNGTHTAVFSEDYRYIVDTYSAVNVPPVTVLRDGRSGKLLLELEKADISELLKTGWQAPEPFAAKGRDGKTDMWGVIYRPTNFDPSKSYPVLEYIYAGPGSAYVPKSFSTLNGFMSYIAELGFIVVQVDCMGTSFRSKAFEEIIYKNLKDGGFLDRIPWIKAAAAKYPYMDINRVGIFGCSAGGQNALGAALFHPEFYKAAYAACGCHDNRMDKIWWNEQWMGEMGPHYAESSNTVNAHRLKSKLMLLVGELDDNVDPSSTMQVVNALIKANKEFELVVIPGAGHTMGEAYGDHKRFDFFVKNLLNVTPPAWEELEKR